jgi:hypothetical protein
MHRYLCDRINFMSLIIFTLFIISFFHSEIRHKHVKFKYKLNYC